MHAYNAYEKNRPVSMMRETYLRAVAANQTDVKLLFGVELGCPNHLNELAGSPCPTGSSTLSSRRATTRAAGAIFTAWTTAKT